jgi:hypothetical protein
MTLPVIISYSNYGYIHFAKNMIINLSKTIKNHKVHFYCLDEETYKELTAMNTGELKITYDLVNLNTSKQFEKYGSLNYNKITHTKVLLLKEALNEYNFIHFIDCDVVCLKEPSIEHYDKYSNCDIVFQYDAGFHSIDKPHAKTIHHIWACTGNTSFKNTTGTQYVLDKIIEYQEKYPSKNDQECLYQYFQDIMITDLREYKHALMLSYNVDEYTNGFWLRNDIGTLKNTYFFHANHVIGMENKIWLLKKANEWYV